MIIERGKWKNSNIEMFHEIIYRLVVRYNQVDNKHRIGDNSMEETVVKSNV